MIFFIVSFLLSLHNAAEECFNVHGLQHHLHFMEDNAEAPQNLEIHKGSGEDEEKAVSVVENFRALLGLNSFHK